MIQKRYSTSTTNVAHEKSGLLSSLFSFFPLLLLLLLLFLLLLLLLPLLLLLLQLLFLALSRYKEEMLQLVAGEDNHNL